MRRAVRQTLLVLITAVAWPARRIPGRVRCPSTGPAIGVRFANTPAGRHTRWSGTWTRTAKYNPRNRKLETLILDGNRSGMLEATANRSAWKSSAGAEKAIKTGNLSKGDATEKQRCWRKWKKRRIRVPVGDPDLFDPKLEVNPRRTGGPWIVSGRLRYKG